MTTVKQAHPNKKFLNLLILTAIILLGLILRLTYRCGLCNPDSFAYLIGAIRINDLGTQVFLQNLVNIYENRISIVFPLAWSTGLFGFSDDAMLLLPLFYAVGTIAITYTLGKLLFNNATALLAAFILATVPLDIFYATAILPDAIIPFYVGMTLLYFALGREKEKRLFFLLSGFFLFCAFEARATSGILIFPLLLIAWWSAKRDIWSLILPAGTFFVLVLTYWSVIFLVNGDFLIQLKLFTQDATVEKYVGTGEFLGYFINNFRLNSEFSLLYVIIFPAVIVAAYKMIKDEAYRLPVITFLALYLFFEFGSTTITSYQPIWKISRFLTILTLPASLIIASVVVWVFPKSPRLLRFVILAILALHIMFAIAFPLIDRTKTQSVMEVNNPYKATFAQLSETENIGSIHTVHFRWTLRGQYYAHQYGKTYHFQNLADQPPDALAAGDIVIFDSIFFTPQGEYELNIAAFPALQSLPKVVPENWELLFVVERAGSIDYPVYVYIVKE